MTHSSVERVIFPDAFNLLHYMIRKMFEVIKNIYVDEKVIEENLKNYNGSERLMLKFIEKGCNRKEAYELVQRYCFGEVNNLNLSEEEIHQCNKIFVEKRSIEEIFERVLGY